MAELIELCSVLAIARYHPTGGGYEKVQVGRTHSGSNHQHGERGISRGSLLWPPSLLLWPPVLWPAPVQRWGSCILSAGSTSNLERMPARMDRARRSLQTLPASERTCSGDNRGPVALRNALAGSLGALGVEMTAKRCKLFAPKTSRHVGVTWPWVNRQNPFHDEGA